VAAPPVRPAPEAGDAGELLRRVGRLELVARRNAAGLLPGDYSTAILGRGLVFHEARRYVPGQPARTIDWNITARVGEPYVRVHREERQREVVLAVDVSPSMHTGFQARTKLETAVELAATLAVSAVDAGDRVGWVTFADRVLGESPPRGGRAQLFRALRALLAAAAPWRRPVAVSDPRVAVHAVQRQRGGGRRVVFLISDFVDHDVPDDLRYVQASHDVTLLHVYDPLELADGAEVPAAGTAAPDDARPRLPAYAPEGRRGGVFRPGELGSRGEMEVFLRREAGRHGIAVASVSTADPVAGSLSRFLHRRRAQRGRR
jgi:uncharacterized protein (DUF58 family)